MISSTKGEAAFTETDLQNWKKALVIHKHESSGCYKEAVARWCEMPSTVKHALEKFNSRRILLKILGNVRYLARQALPLRGDWKATEK